MTLPPPGGALDPTGQAQTVATQLSLDIDNTRQFQESGGMLAPGATAPTATLFQMADSLTGPPFESVAVVRPTPSALTDAGYFVVNRTLNGVTTRTIERTHGREFEDVRDAFFVDAGLTFDNPVAIEDIDEANPVKITITAHPFLNGDDVDIDDIEWVPDVDAEFNTTQPDQLNGGRFEVANVTANDFTLKSIDTGDDIDGSAFRNGCAVIVILTGFASSIRMEA